MSLSYAIVLVSVRWVDDSMRLYGTDICPDCITAKMLLEKNNIEYVWIDVSTIPGFDSEIPLLVLDDGSTVIGFVNIRRKLSI